MIRFENALFFCKQLSKVEMSRFEKRLFLFNIWQSNEIDNNTQSNMLALLMKSYWGQSV